MWFPNVVYAQEPAGRTDLIDWQELKTEKFTIVYADRVVVSGIDVDCVCGIKQAEFYAEFIDHVYEDLVVVFGTELGSAVNLRLFPTEESYYQVNPLAERLTGVIAHALNSREEIAIALPRTVPLTNDE